MINNKRNKADNKDTKDNLSFFEKIRTDKKYSAKVQLIGYGVLIVVLVLYLNIANMGRTVPSGNLVPDDISDGNTSLENTEHKSNDLLKEIDKNYQYDQHVVLKRKNGDVGEELSSHYYGKSYGNNLEINKEDATGIKNYYKIEDRYYVKDDTGVVFTDVDIVYDLVDGEYLELSDIKKLMNKASLDHVTDYSSGKKEYVYHLKVKDIILSYQKDDVVEIGATLENDTLTIHIDYSNLLSVIDENVLECSMEVVYTEIGKIEEFQVLGDENASIE